MAKEYLEKLTHLVESLDLKNEFPFLLETKHFFSGAALYANNKICASWTPAGLAFKLPEEEVEKLISSGKAKPLQYFPKGHVKKGYALFQDPELRKHEEWKNYFLQTIRKIERNEYNK